MCGVQLLTSTDSARKSIGCVRQRISDELKAHDCAEYLANLWLYAMMYTSDGILHEMDATDIATVAGWEREPSPFIDTMLNNGVLLVTPSGEYTVNSWVG